MKLQISNHLIYRWALFVSLLISVSLSGAGCAGVETIHELSVAGVAQPPPPIAAGQVVGIYPGTTSRLLAEAIRDAPGTELWLQETTGNLTAVRPVTDQIDEFVNINIDKLRSANGNITGNMCRTCDWQGIREMLAGLGYKIVTGVELAAYYTARGVERLSSLSSITFPTLLAAPVGLFEVDPIGYFEAVEGIDQ